jgi:hypothetical protein
VPARAYKDFHSKISIPLQVIRALNQYVSFSAPRLDHEYKSNFQGDFMYAAFVRGGLDATVNMMSTNIKDLSGDGTDQGDLLKRWGQITPHLDEFISRAKPGDVFTEHKFRAYSPGAPQQFRNSPYLTPFKLMNGTTVIDLGFVDFGCVLDSIDSIEDDSSRPVLVVAYDAEQMCVAKTSIMLEMMKVVSVAPRSIVEVWLSSLWSEATYSAFRAAIRILVTRGGLEPKVEAVLHYWGLPRNKISRKVALDFQLKGLKGESRFAMTASHFSTADERVEYLRYHRTKALYEDASTTLGSVVMSSEDASIGVKQHYGDCLEAYPAQHQEVQGGYQFLIISSPNEQIRGIVIVFDVGDQYSMPRR